MTAIDRSIAAGIAGEYAVVNIQCTAALIEYTAVVCRVAGEFRIINIQRTSADINRCAAVSGFVPREEDIADRDTAIGVRLDRTAAGTQITAGNDHILQGDRAIIEDHKLIGSRSGNGHTVRTDGAIDHQRDGSAAQRCAVHIGESDPVAVHDRITVRVVVGSEALAEGDGIDTVHRQRRSLVVCRCKGFTEGDETVRIVYHIVQRGDGEGGCFLDGEVCPYKGEVIVGALVIGAVGDRIAVCERDRINTCRRTFRTDQRSGEDIAVLQTVHRVGQFRFGAADGDALGVRRDREGGFADNQIGVCGQSQFKVIRHIHIIFAVLFKDGYAVDGNDIFIRADNLRTVFGNRAVCLPDKVQIVGLFHAVHGDRDLFLGLGQHEGVAVRIRYRVAVHRQGDGLFRQEVEGIRTDLEDLLRFFLQFQRIETVHTVSVLIHILSVFKDMIGLKGSIDCRVELGNMFLHAGLQAVRAVGICQNKGHDHGGIRDTDPVVVCHIQIVILCTGPVHAAVGGCPGDERTALGCHTVSAQGEDFMIHAVHGLNRSDCLSVRDRFKDIGECLR